jgi:hypothetical protein
MGTREKEVVVPRGGRLYLGPISIEKYEVEIVEEREVRPALNVSDADFGVDSRPDIRGRIPGIPWLGTAGCYWLAVAIYDGTPIEGHAFHIDERDCLLRL